MTQHDFEAGFEDQIWQLQKMTTISIKLFEIANPR